MVVRDFCPGGFFLEVTGSGRGSPLLAQDITIQLSRTHDHRLGEDIRARVVRRTAGGLGIAFQQREPALISALEALARNQQATRQPATGQRRSRLADEAIRLCSEHAEGFCRRTLPDFVANAVDELFQRARSATSNDRQNAYFTAYRLLRKQRDDIPQQITNELRARIERLSTPSSRGHGLADRERSEVELALVDEQEFEDWLSRAEAVNRAEKRVLRELEALNRRLTFVAGRLLDETDNPLAPAGFCDVITDILPQEQLGHHGMQAIYEVFGQVVLQSLDTLYAPLNDRLRERGLLPDIEKERPTIHPLGQGGPTAAEAQSPPDPTAETPDAPSAPATATPHGAGSSAVTPTPARGQPAATANRPSTTPVLPSVEHLLESQRQLRQWRTPSAAAPEPTHVATATPAGQRQVLDAVGHLQREVTDPPERGQTGLMDRVIDSLRATSSDDAELAPETQDTVELLDQWFGDIQHNTLNTEFLREWSSRVAVLALRVQLEQGGFLTETPQPIHRLLDGIDRAGLAVGMLRGQDRDRLQQRIADLLQQALGESYSGPEGLTTAAERLDELIERPLQIRATNMQRVLQQCEGAQRRERARRRVDEEIDRRLGGHRVPELLIEFLEQGWRGLMVLVLLRSGGHGDEWRRILAVVDRLLTALGCDDRPGRPIAEPEKVLAFAQHQLATNGRLGRESTATLAVIREHVLAVCAGSSPPGQLPMRVVPRISEREPDDGDETASRWRKQAGLLTPGDWVYFAGARGTPEPLRLQWIADDGDRFVFVDRRGHKARELTGAELGQQLEAAAAGVSDDMDQPLTERQWQRRLQAMHQQMVRYATTDALTGLLNRRSLLTEVERLLASAGGRSRQHALLNVSLDGFKIVNGNLGNEAGDEVLQSIAEDLRQSVGSRGVVGRTGGDEFTILLRDCADSEADAAAEERRRALHERRATRGGETVTISASIGVASFTPNGQTAPRLLQNAEEACLTAKHAGGNRVHVLTADDREVSQLRTTMARTARVDTALESGLLRLRCQRIQPLVDEAGMLPLYEVLVAMQGPDGELIPPGEFIPAAERFGRMNAVDRWVIHEILKWSAAHPDALEQLAGFSVNLSGTTLNDDGFADHLRRCLEETQVSGERICFEVTETAAVQNLASAATLIRDISALGCRFALDDFGSGLSSYAYLKKLPVDYLKIDGQFIREIDHSPEDHAMVRSISDLGHFMGKRTIAEYVENETILFQLREIGLDFAQGFGIEKPIPIGELHSRLTG